MKRIYLVRHLQSVGNIDKNEYTKYENQDIPLSKEGIKQGTLTAIKLNSALQKGDKNKIWLSPFKRTRHTSNIILHYFKEIFHSAQEDDSLTEMDFGLFYGISRKDMAIKYKDELAIFRQEKIERGKYYARPPNGTSPEDIDKNLTLLLKTIEFEFEDEFFDNIVIISHGVALNVLFKKFVELTPEEFSSMPVSPNGSIRVLELHQKTWVDKGFL